MQPWTWHGSDYYDREIDEHCAKRRGKAAGSFGNEFKGWTYGEGGEGLGGNFTRKR